MNIEERKMLGEPALQDFRAEQCEMGYRQHRGRDQAYGGNYASGQKFIQKTDKNSHLEYSNYVCQMLSKR